MGQSAIGICAFFHLLNLLGVMVLHRSMLNWRRGWGQSDRYMCILLSVKLIRCNGVAQIYASLEEGVGQSAIGIGAFFYL